MRGRSVERAPLSVGPGTRRVAVEPARMAPTQAALYDELSRRPTALVVGAGAARARAHEARPPTPSRTSGSSSRSSSRRSSAGTSSRVPVFSIRSPARARRSCSALESGHDAVGVDVAAFNCLLMRVKTARYDLFRLETEVRDALARRGRVARAAHGLRAGVVRAASRRHELLHFRSLVDEYEHADVLRVVLARAARSARLTTHFDLDFPRVAAARAVLVPQAPAQCAPVQEAQKFLTRYLLDTLERIKAFHKVEGPCSPRPTVVHGDSRDVELDGAVRRRSSPRRRIPGSSTTTSSIATRTSCSASTTGASASSAPRRGNEPRGARGVRRGDRCACSPSCRLDGSSRRSGARRRERPARPLSGDPLQSGLRLVERLERHVNRRTGRRAGEYFESIFVAVGCLGVYGNRKNAPEQGLAAECRG